MIKIRNEAESDYRKVEELTRKAFYNLYIPGGTEHYLVHVMRSHFAFHLSIREKAMVKG